MLMGIRRWLPSLAVTAGALLASVSAVQAQTAPDASRWFVDLAFGVAPSINGNVNSGAIGVLRGQATAFLPQSYADVYGAGLDFRFGGGYVLSPLSEVHAVFAWQTADADLVRLGDIGPSSLYAQYSDYKTLGLDIGYRRYIPISSSNIRAYGEAAIGAAFISRINAEFAAPQSNLIFTQTDLYDRTAAFTWAINFGALFRLNEMLDLNAQVGIRHVGGLSNVDQFVGTGLETVTDNSSRLTFPIVVGVRFKIK